MAKRYSAVKPATGSPGLIRTGGGRARVGSLPKTPKASFSIDLNLGQLREQQEHRQRVKTLRESGLYEGIDLNNVPADKVTAMYANLPQDLRAYTKAKLEESRAIDRGDFLKEMEDIKATPKGWIGSEYDPSSVGASMGEELPMPPDTQRVEGDLDLRGGTDDIISNFMAGRYDAAGKRGGLGGQVPDAQIDLDRDFPSGDEEGFGARTIGDIAGSFEDNLEWFDIEEGFGLKKKIGRDELGEEHGPTTEWYPDGTAKSQTDYEHGKEVSRIEYDRSGEIEKVVGDPLGMKEGPPQKPADALASLFQGLDPQVATNVHKQYTVAQEAFGKKPQVIDAFKNTKEVTRYDPKTNKTYVKWIKKGTGKIVGKEILIPTDPEKGYYTTTFDDDRGKNIVTLDRVGNIDRLITIPKNLKEKNWNPQVLLLADFLKDGILEEVYGGRSFKELSAPEQGALMTKAFKDARNPAQYVYSHPEIITPLREFSKEKGKIEQLTELVEAVAKLGSNEENQGNTLRNKFDRLQKR